jgi:hypothetical protein
MNYPDRYPTWIHEQAPHHHGPTSGGMLRLAVLVLVAVICWQWFTATDSGRDRVDTKQGVSLCEEHPHWSVCQPGPSDPVSSNFTTMPDRHHR